MQSAVQSRIASFEAASSNGVVPSPSRPTSQPISKSSPRAILDVAIPEFAKQQHKQQQEKEEDPIETQQQRSHQFRRKARESRKKTKTSTSDTNLNTSICSDKNDGQDYKNNSEENFETASSTTATASEIRKNRIRQSQQFRENNNTSPSANLSDKRRQRRVLQSQRRTKLSSKEASNNTKKEVQDDEKADRTTDARTPIDNTRVPDSPGDMSTGSAGRWSKLSRLQRRPNSINQRQSSAATNVTKTSGNSATTALIRNTANKAKLGSRSGLKSSTPKFKSRTVEKIMSATAALSPRNRHKHESPKNSSSPSQRSLQSTRSSRSISNFGGGADQQQWNASLEAPTDDDATLTSVHRIMQGSNTKHKRLSSDNSQNQNHSYETLQAPSVSGRKIVKQDNQNSYDSSVGPSWKLNRGAGNRNTIWKEDEKSDKIGYGAAGGRVLRTEYSSDYDMDDVRSRQSSTHFAEGPSNSQTTNANDYFATSSRYHNTNNMNNNVFQNNINSNNRRIDDDDRTFDYGDRDDDSNGGTSYVRRRREVEQRRGRLTANDLNSNVPNGTLEQSIHQAVSANGNNGEPMLLTKDDMEHLMKKDDSLIFRLTAGVVAVATVGLLISGPVGMLAGVAAGGLGMGFMRIPEEERKKIQERAEKGLNSLQEKACDASEVMSSSCINTYQDSGVAEHVPHCISSNIADQLVPSGPTGGTVKSENFGNAGGGTVNSAQINGILAGGGNNPEHSSTSPTGPLVDQKAPSSMTHNERMRPKKVACLRNVRILPIAQIHGLEPSSQPRAWLDVVASANTSNDQKTEAMEEILLLAKDKRRARIFLDEGILDYIIWTISRYFEKLEVIGKTTEWAFPDITPNEKTAANLAAMCCVTLGKAHCAAIHTEGDLLLMSMYERGSVPEERQVAQMLHEVSHHARVTKTNDPTIVQPSKEVFAPRQLNLNQAEELARSIKLVADGQV